MKKRFICTLLALLMLISLVPVSTLSVSAASDRSYSDDVVAYIKEWEGFSEKAFWNVSQWSIGYGTSSTEGATITKEEAETVLRERLSGIDTKINQFAAQNNLDFSQTQHDALVSLCFNVGTEWLNQSGRLRSAIVNGSTGNDFLFAISLWANISGVPDRGLLQRRLSEANLYLNGTYAKAVPSNYSYVILNPNGGTPGHSGEDKMQGYSSSTAVGFLAADPTKSGKTFGGWYTATTGGEYVGELTAQTAGKTLYAQWGISTKVTSEYVNVRSNAGTSYTQLGQKKTGDTLVIVQTEKVGDALWGRFSGGWVALQYTDFSSVAGDNAVLGQEESSIGTGIVKCDTYVNVRSGAGTHNPVTGSIPKGTKVTVYEVSTVNGQKWGRIGSGWMSLAYVEMDNSSDSLWSNTQSSNTTQATTDPVPGTVTGNGVNVRNAAGVGNTIVTVLNKGASVKVFEQVTKDNAPWGRIEQGWICMNYVSLNQASTENNSTTENKPSESVVSTGTVSAKTNLNVRSGAGTNYPSVKYLTPNTKVNIYETTTVSGRKWGRIDDKNWVCLSYVNLDEAANNSTNNNTTILETGIVNTSTGLNVRCGAGTNYARVQTLNPGTKVFIYEKTTVSGQKWGRIDGKNWICLSYVKLDASQNSSSTATTPAEGTGTVTSKTALNIRSNAGTGNVIVGSYASGAAIKILEQKDVQGIKWGRTDKGWVCMTYVQMGTQSTTTSKIVWN